MLKMGEGRGVLITILQVLDKSFNFFLKIGALYDVTQIL